VAATELKSKVEINGMVKSFERLTIGAAAETLATSGATIPNGTTQILCLPSAILTHHPTGTPTASFGHAIAVKEAFVIEHQDIPRTKIFATGGDQTMDVVYFGYESNF
jgi:hypothetical protein